MKKLGIAGLCLFSLLFSDAGSIFAMEHHSVVETKFGDFSDLRAVTLDLEGCKLEIIKTIKSTSSELALWEEATGETKLVAENGGSYSTEVPLYKRSTESGVEIGFSLNPRCIFEHFRYVRPASADSVLLDTPRIKELGDVFDGETISLKRVFSADEEIDVILQGKGKIIYRQNGESGKKSLQKKGSQEKNEELKINEENNEENKTTKVTEGKKRRLYKAKRYGV